MSSSNTLAARTSEIPQHGCVTQAVESIDIAAYWSRCKMRKISVLCDTECFVALTSRITTRELSGQCVKILTPQLHSLPVAKHTIGF